MYFDTYVNRKLQVVLYRTNQQKNIKKFDAFPRKSVTLLINVYFKIFINFKTQKRTMNTHASNNKRRLPNLFYETHWCFSDILLKSSVVSLSSVNIFQCFIVPVKKHFIFSLSLSHLLSLDINSTECAHHKNMVSEISV
jgi:hypothetical protein